LESRSGRDPVREQVIAAGATPIMKAEGIWTGVDGTIWFVASRGDGPDAEDPEDVSAAAHSGQIWRYDPYDDTIELVVLFPHGSRFDGPDNITAGPRGCRASHAPTARTTSGSSASTTKGASSRSRSTRWTTPSSPARRLRRTARPCSSTCSIAEQQGLVASVHPGYKRLSRGGQRGACGPRRKPRP
jgi:hypothetical protein